MHRALVRNFQHPRPLLGGKVSGDVDISTHPVHAAVLLVIHFDFELAALEVEVDHEEHGGVYRMRRDIHVTGDLSAEQRTRMLEIANKCPVHRTLSGSFDIVSQLD